MEVYLDTWDYTPHRTTDFEVKIENGRLYLYMDDHCDCVGGYFRSKEDIIKVRDELNKYLEYVETGETK